MREPDRNYVGHFLAFHHALRRIGLGPFMGVQFFIGLACGVGTCLERPHRSRTLQYGKVARLAGLRVAGEFDLIVQAFSFLGDCREFR
jgi:hypothetical protein